MKSSFLGSILVVALGSAFLPARADVEFLWGVTGVAGQASDLYAINPANGQLLGLVGSTGTVNVSGLARHPVTGELYAAQGQMSDKQLLRIDPTTGVATAVGPIGFAVSDAAFRADGTFYAYGASNLDLFTISLASGTPTMIGNNVAGIGTVGMTFGAGGEFFMTRSNSVVSASPVNGAVVTGPFIIGGATGSVDNLLATNSGGTVYAATRNNKSAPTTLYTLNPATGATTLVGSISGVALSGMEFGMAAPPSLKLKGKTKIKTTKSTVKLKGTATSFLPLTVATKGAKTASVNAGTWTLKVKVKRGKNRLKLLCADGMGQSVTQKLVVTRASK